MTLDMQQTLSARSSRPCAWCLGIASLTPLLIVGIVPFITGDVPMSNLIPLLPLGHDAQGNLATATFGAWNGTSITMAMGAMRKVLPYGALVLAALVMWGAHRLARG